MGTNPQIDTLEASPKFWVQSVAMNPIQSVLMNPTQESQTLNLGHNPVESIGIHPRVLSSLTGATYGFSNCREERIKSQEKIPVSLFPTQNTRTKW